MKLMTWLTKQDTPGFSDYSTHLIKMDTISRVIHDACLHRNYEDAKRLIDELIEESVLLKKWLKDQK